MSTWRGKRVLIYQFILWFLTGLCPNVSLLYQPDLMSSCNAPPHEALRDDTKIGFVADYSRMGWFCFKKISLYFEMHATYFYP